MKKALIWSMKIGMIIGTAILLIGVGIWGYVEVAEFRNEREMAPLKVVKIWDEVKVESINAHFALATKLDGLLYLRMSITPIKGSQLPSLESVTMIFYDLNGFRLFEQKVLSTDMYREVDAKGKVMSYSVNQSAFVSSDDYSKATSWTVSWQEN